MTALALTQLPGRKLPFIKKVFVWSIVFESLLFFIIGSQFTTGFVITVGKLLQIGVMLVLPLAHLAYGRDIQIVNPAAPAYKYFTAFWLLAVVSGVIGASTGAYELQNAYLSEYANTDIARVIRGPATRPIIEYGILLYYFVYFTVLPRYMLRTDEAKRYFFAVFRFAFSACLVLGFIDLVLDGFGYEWIPRDMSEGRHVLFRFHGLAGEPRDAFVYLMFGLAVLNLEAFWKSRAGVSRAWIGAVFIAAIFTQSASGLLGLLFGVGLVVVASAREISVRHVLWLVGIILVLISVVLISARNSPRIKLYLGEAAPLLLALQGGKAPPPLITLQMVNIYPVWDLYRKTVDGDLRPVLIGSGLGTASVVNNNLAGTQELANPNSEVIRLLYECGLIGTVLLVIAFMYPVKQVTSLLSAVERRRFLIFTCLLIGLFLAHRSTTAFIYLGIFLAVLGGPGATLAPLVHGGSSRRPSA